MAWKSSGFSNENLVATLKENGLIKSSTVENAFLAVDRKFYSPNNFYEDKPVKLGFGATISAPHMHAICLEALKDHLHDGCKVLDVGCGSGYLTACFAAMVGHNGKVIGLDHIPELVELSRKNVSTGNNDLLERIVFVGENVVPKSFFLAQIINLQFEEGDGRRGYEKEAPFDVIHVGAAAFGVPPALTQQLKISGRLLLPVANSLFGSQHLLLVDKQLDESLVESKMMSVRYVPLASVETQLTGVMSDHVGSGTIDMLNDDTLLLIFGFIMQKQWLILESVCKRWMLLIRQTWKRLKKVEIYEILGVTPVSHCEIPYHTPTIKDKLLEGLAERCSKVATDLSVGCRARMGLKSLNVLALEFLRLISLDLSYVSLIIEDEEDQSFDMIGVFGNLKVLNLKSCFDDSLLQYHNFETVDPILFKLFSSMPQVEQVNLSHNTMLNGSCLLGLSTSVQSLDLSFCRRMSGETLMLAFSSLPNLTHVSLYSNNRLTGACLPYLSGRLTSADLSFCDAIEHDTLKHFIVTHPELINLQIAHIKCLSNDILEKICQLKRLETLNLNSYFKTSYYEQLQHPLDIAKGLKGLQSIQTLKTLDLSKNDFVGDSVLIGLGYGCCKLEDLNVSQLCSVNQIGFSSLGRLSNLKRLDISGNECVDDTVLLSISHGGSLEFVNARKCEQITEATLKRLSGFWPNNITVFQVY